MPVKLQAFRAFGMGFQSHGTADQVQLHSQMAMTQEHGWQLARCILAVSTES